MKNFAFILLSFLISFSALAGAPIIWGAGSTAQLLTNSLSFLTPTNPYLISGILDPSAVAVDAPEGTIYMSTNGKSYTKQDSGSSTNWSQLVITGVSAIGTINSATKSANGAVINGSNQLVMQEADATHNGLVSTGTQSLAGDKTFNGVALISNGTVTAPGLGFTNSTNSGLYLSGTNEIAIGVNGVRALDFIKSTGGGAFGNIGMGGAASVSDSYPLLIQRSVASAGVYEQVSNTNTAASSKATYQLAADAGGNTGEVSLFTSATLTDAYANAMTVRPSDATGKLSLIGGDLVTGYVTTYGGGDYASTGETTRFNADHTNQFMQSVTAPASPAAGLKFYNNAGVFSSKTTGGTVSSFAGTNTGDITLGSVGSSPAAAGASLSAQVLTLQPADGSNPGVVTTGTQTMAGAKTFSGGITATVTGNASTATTATNATNIAVTDDTTTNTTMYPLWVTTTTGNLPAKLSSTKMTFNPSTATLTATTFAGALSGNATSATSATSATTATTATNIAGGSGGSIPYQSAAATTAMLANGTANQYLASAGTTLAPVWTSFAAPTIQKFTSTGTETGKVFTITSGNATVGATYTNNSVTYTVLATIAAQTTLYMSGTGTTSGSTLTRSSGSGDGTITFSASQSLATYTTPTSPRTPLYLHVRMVGPGGGGAGSATTAAHDGASGGAGGLGIPTTFSATGSGLLSASPGLGGPGGGANNGGAGGTASIGTAIGFALAGSAGGPGQTVAAAAGGQGGVSALGGAGGGGTDSSAGTAAIANSGSGGGGGGDVSSSATAAGGGAGGYVDAIITSPVATYFYIIPAGGTFGAAGTSGRNGGAGGSGFIEVEEKYQ